MRIDDAALEAVGLGIPRLLLPAAGVALERWAVVACDQYTSEPEYWQAVERKVGSAPSTLRLIYPEVYLDEPDGKARIQSINETMRIYLADGSLQPADPGFVLVKRSFPSGKQRLGLVAALDLERYDFSPDSSSLVRATEGTILERLPPRIEVRKQAPIELPHIMVLIDDPERTVIEPLAQISLPPAYDFFLMQGAGRLEGAWVRAPEHINGIVQALTRLAAPARMRARYGAPGDAPLLYAVGDGNHSLATAKSIWEAMKREGRATPDHPARFALVELVNLHDVSLEFEAIHRVLFGVAPERLDQAFAAYLEARGARLRVESGDRTVLERLDQSAGDVQVIATLSDAGWRVLSIENAPHTLAVGTLQGFLDAYLKQNPGRVDYVHGVASVEKLARGADRMGYFLPVIGKHDLFRTVLCDGPLPRKAFSMGQAHEKRFYMEARRITP